MSDDEEIATLRDALKLATESLGKMIVAEQAAWIEWKRGKGAEAAMVWIHNGLCGPGLIPDESEPYASEPQAYFDANRPDKFPPCDCGRPGYILSRGMGYCEQHAGEHLS